jgi:hypothetical protein
MAEKHTWWQERRHEDSGFITCLTDFDTMNIFTIYLRKYHFCRNHFIKCTWHFALNGSRTRSIINFSWLNLSTHAKDYYMGFERLDIRLWIMKSLVPKCHMQFCVFRVLNLLGNELEKFRHLESNSSVFSLHRFGKEIKKKVPNYCQNRLLMSS